MAQVCCLCIYITLNMKENILGGAFCNSPVTVHVYSCSCLLFLFYNLSTPIGFWLLASQFPYPNVSHFKWGRHNWCICPISSWLNCCGSRSWLVGISRTLKIFSRKHDFLWSYRIAICCSDSSRWLLFSSHLNRN